MAIVEQQPYSYRFRVRAIALGQSIINHFDYRQESDPFEEFTPAEELEALLALRNRWEALMLPFLPPQYRPTVYELQQIRGIATPPESGASPYSTYFGTTQVVIPAVATGALVGTILPTVFAASVRRIPTFSTKYWRSNTRIGPLTEENVQDQNLLSVWREELEEALNEFMEPVVIVGPPVKQLVNGIFSPWAMAVKDPPEADPYDATIPIQLYSVHIPVSTQRSRRPSLLGD